jgi:hypothetical protein
MLFLTYLDFPIKSLVAMTMAKSSSGHGHHFMAYVRQHLYRGAEAHHMFHIALLRSSSELARGKVVRHCRRRATSRDIEQLRQVHDSINLTFATLALLTQAHPLPDPLSHQVHRTQQVTCILPK